MRRLKIATTACLAVGFIGLASWPLIVRLRPERGSDAEAFRRYAWQSSAYLFVLLLAFVGASVGAFLIVRLARKEFEVRSRENLRALVEGARMDIRKERDGDS